MTKSSEWRPSCSEHQVGVDDLPSRQAPGSRVAWQHLLGALATLTALAVVLPSPAECVDVLGGRGPQGISSIDALAVGGTALLLAAALAVWFLLIWGAAVALAALTGRLPGGVGRRGRALLAQIAPGVARRLVLTAVGASMVTGLAVGGTGTATAASVPVDEPPGGVGPSVARVVEDEVGRSPGRPDPASSWTSVEGSAVQLGSNPVPPAGGPEVGPAGQLDVDWPMVADRVDAAAPKAAAPKGVAPKGVAPKGVAPKGPVDIDWPAAATPVVVLRGDSLWSIAAHHLPPNADDGQIEKAWQQWFSANSTVIGHDPNLILPGQILQPPNQEAGHRS